MKGGLGFIFFNIKRYIENVVFNIVVFIRIWKDLVGRKNVIRYVNGLVILLRMVDKWNVLFLYGSEE